MGTLFELKRKNMLNRTKIYSLDRFKFDET